jgi:predicted ATPase
METVLDAVEEAISRLTDRDDLTAIVVLGEDIGADELSRNLATHAAALAKAVDQAGLFITLAAQDVVRDRLMGDVRFEGFGIFSAEDSDRSERLFAVIHPDIYEPLLPQKHIAGNCPKLQRSFVGRHTEVDELQDLILFRSLVTVIGPPGVGKTTTAMHVARSFSDEYEDGVWWFSAEDKTSLDDLLDVMGRAKGLLRIKGTFTSERVAEELRGKNCVIILDGCEVLLNDIGRFCSDVLAQASSVTFLVTSTKPLGVPGEHVYRLNPMSLPRHGEVGDDALIASGALALFFERATQAGERLPLDDDTIEEVSHICELLDGLPVAIEIAASSLRTTSLAKLKETLDRDLADVFRRSHGLEKALSVSFNVLQEGSRILLPHLAMFRGEWKVSAVAELWPDRFEREALLRLHQTLADASWIAYEKSTDTYRMLHTLRSFVASEPSTDFDALLRDYCARLATFAQDTIQEQRRRSFEDASVLLRHYPDFMHGFETAMERRLDEPAHTFMSVLVTLWVQRNLNQDAVIYSRAYLDLGVEGMQAARAYNALGTAYMRQRRLLEARENYLSCLAIARQVKNVLAQAIVLSNLCIISCDLSDFDAARGYSREALDLVRPINAPERLCATLCNDVDLEFKAIEHYRQIGKPPSPDFEANALEIARSRLREMEPLLPQATPWLIQAYHTCMGSLCLYEEDLSAAETSFNRAIAICVKHGIRHEATEALEGLAEISLERKAAPTAAKFIGLAKRIRSEYKYEQTDLEVMRYGILLKKLHSLVDLPRAEKLLQYGARLDIAEILSTTIFDA